MVASDVAQGEQLRRLSTALAGESSLDSIITDFITDGTGPLSSAVLQDYFRAQNNQLTVISGFLAFMDSEFWEQGSSTQLLEEARRANRRATALSAAMLSLDVGAAIAAKTQRPMQLGRLVEGLEPMLAAVCGNNTTLKLELQPDAAAVSLRPALLERALVAWLAASKMRDFEPDGSITITTSGTPPAGPDQRAESQSAHAHLVIRRAPFRAVQRNATPEDSQEAKLGERHPPGLASVAQLAAKLGGQLHYEAGPFGHWELCLSFPVCGEASAAVSTPSRHTAHSNKCLRVLLVEEDANERWAVQIAAGALGCTVRSVSSGSEALELVMKDGNTFDAIVADAGCKGIRGTHLGRLLLSESPCTQLIYASSSPRSGIEDLPAGCRFLQKPFQPEAVTQALLEIERSGGSIPRVLVVEDEPGLRCLIRTVLEQDGHLVDEAENGLQATEALQTTHYDLMVLDLVMPGREGLETIRAICRRSHSLRILAMSGHRPEYLKAARFLGADATLAKPFESASLRAVVKALLESN